MSQNGIKPQLSQSEARKNELSKYHLRSINIDKTCSNVYLFLLTELRKVFSVPWALLYEQECKDTGEKQKKDKHKH